MSRRDQNVMLRLTSEEHAALMSARPAGEELASFARRTLLAALASTSGVASIREAAAFVVAALSNEIDFDEAILLYDDHVQARRGGMNDGLRH